MLALAYTGAFLHGSSCFCTASQVVPLLSAYTTAICIVGLRVVGSLPLTHYAVHSPTSIHMQFSDADCCGNNDLESGGILGHFVHV